MAIHQINEVIVENYNTSREQPAPPPAESATTVEAPEVSSSPESADSSATGSSTGDSNVDTYA